MGQCSGEPYCRPVDEYVGTIRYVTNRPLKTTRPSDELENEIANRYRGVEGQVTERLARNVPLTSENAELLRQCTFEPHLFTKGPYTYPDPRHGAEPKGEFHERLDADRGRREAKSCSFAREERDTKRWFDTHAALRDPHVSHGGKPRVIPDAKW